MAEEIAGTDEDEMYTLTLHLGLLFMLQQMLTSTTSRKVDHYSSVGIYLERAMNAR
jgi:hypothetical protein